ncbi:MAG: phage tail protein [Paracoccus sp. (in: a-proteobacteria)]|uniref:phage tail protein n=1 Tax=Paracoccus sp. TaxID=267 RepID=UPI0026DF91CE|nr:phage tail protein [Paracoccus sp. (in: a-proteobacteria)]MDO5622358.1 phage tail protein [Paracoccus sp. (in: a-proteobacteria)]
MEGRAFPAIRRLHLDQARTTIQREAGDIVAGSVAIFLRHPFTPFLSLAESHNAVHAQYPEPAERWVAKEAPPRYSAEHEAEDQGRRLIASVSLPTAPYPNQVQRMMQFMLQEERRMARHELPMPPDFAVLEPLDAVAWTSARNGYVNKVFEVASKTDYQRSLNQRIALRERDSADVIWRPTDLLPSAPVSVATPLPVAEAVPGFDARGITLLDKDGRARRPACQLTWDADQPDVQGIHYEIRVSGRVELAGQGSTMDVSAGGLVVVDGVLPGTDMEARARLVVNRPVIWSAWRPFQTADIKIPLVEIDDTPPPRPAAPALTAALGKISASWVIGVEDTAYSDLELIEGSGNPVWFQSGGTSYEWSPVKPGVDYKIRRREVDRVGNKSPWSDYAAIKSTTDTTPPATPTGLKLTAGFNTIWIEWDRNTEDDLAYYEVAAGAASFTEAAAPANIIASTVANSFVLTELPDGTSRHIRVRAVDTSGNASPWTAALSKATVASPKITTQELQGLVDATSFAAGIEPVRVVTTASLPTVKDTSAIVWQGQLYRWDGTKYTASVAAGDVTGQFVASQIATGAVGAEQIAAGAITTSKLGVGDFTNKVPDNQLSDPASWVFYAASAGAFCRRPRWSRRCWRR